MRHFSPFLLKTDLDFKTLGIQVLLASAEKHPKYPAGTMINGKNVGGQWMPLDAIAGVQLGKKTNQLILQKAQQDPSIAQNFDNWVKSTVESLAEQVGDNAIAKAIRNGKSPSPNATLKEKLEFYSGQAQTVQAQLNATQSPASFKESLGKALHASAPIAVGLAIALVPEIAIPLILEGAIEWDLALSSVAIGQALDAGVSKGLDKAGIDNTWVRVGSSIFTGLLSGSIVTGVGRKIKNVMAIDPVAVKQTSKEIQEKLVRESEEAAKQKVLHDLSQYEQLAEKAKDLARSAQPYFQRLAKIPSDDTILDAIAQAQRGGYGVFKPGSGTSDAFMKITIEGKEYFLKEARKASANSSLKEVVASKIGSALGLDAYVPVVKTVQKSGQDKSWMITPFMEGEDLKTIAARNRSRRREVVRTVETRLHTPSQEEVSFQGEMAKGMENAIATRMASRQDVHRIALFDYLIGNGDRNAGNIFLPKQGPVQFIDHELAFSSNPHLPTTGVINSLIEKLGSEGKSVSFSREVVEDILSKKDLVLAIADELNAPRITNSILKRFQQLEESLAQNNLGAEAILFGRSG